TGGYIGIAAMPGFLGGSGDLKALIDHADYAIRTFGSEHVAIGTDRVHLCSIEGEEARLDALQRPKQRPMFHSLWAEDEPIMQKQWQQPHMIESTAWTNWPLITVGLVQRGHSDEAIARVLGGNVLRVARAVLDGRGAE